jgi:PAS domain S-box-containing protein
MPRQTEGAKAAANSTDAGLDSDLSFRLLVDSVRDYAIVMLDTDGRVVSWNEGAERIKGYTRKEIIGKDFSCFYPPEAIQQGVPRRELELAAREERFEDEGWRVRKDGSKFWASVVINAVRDEKGSLRGYAKITRDLTERKQAEERIQQQSKEIMDLSTPVMQVWQGVVTAPLIGSLDSERTQQFMERLLNRIVETNSPVALVDIMGVPTIDTQTAQHLIETISAVRLLGAQVILTGVRPVIAQTLVHLGIDLSDIITRSSLAAGVQVALDILNLQVVEKKAAN